MLNRTYTLNRKLRVFQMSTLVNLNASDMKEKRGIKKSEKVFYIECE